MSSIILQVYGLSYGACVKQVSAALSPLVGVHDVCIDLPAGQVRVEGEVEPRTLLIALRDAGYPARVPSTAGAAAVAPGGRCGLSDCWCH
jgi:copper chaperone CopZ